LAVYLEHDNPGQPATAALIGVLRRPIKERIHFLRDVLRRMPDAVVVIDPFEMFFPIEKRKETAVLWTYQQLRFLLADFPAAAIIMSFNLRKRDRSVQPPDLLVSPRGWLEEVAGSIEIMNRSDVRIGFDFHRRDAEVRVLNGVRRGEEFDPVLLRSVGVPPDLEGFEQVVLQGQDLDLAFTANQIEYWNALPTEFKFEAVADRQVPRSSLSRLLARAQSLGLVEKAGDGFRRRYVSISIVPDTFRAPQVGAACSRTRAYRGK
jgi:CRP-like cAMP-binding protein